MYEESGLKRTREDNVGAELTFVYAKDFKKLNWPEANFSRNLAIKAFIEALPEDTPIILWW